MPGLGRHSVRPVAAGQQPAATADARGPAVYRVPAVAAADQPDGVAAVAAVCGARTRSDCVAAVPAVAEQQPTVPPGLRRSAVAAVTDQQPGLAGDTPVRPLVVAILVLIGLVVPYKGIHALWPAGRRQA